MSADFRAHLLRRLMECDVPEHLHDGLIAYLTTRRPVGSFLTAVLENDLAGAVTRADPSTSPHLRRIVLFLFNYAPSPCWGSAQRVQAWLADPEPVQEIFE